MMYSIEPQLSTQKPLPQLVLYALLICVLALQVLDFSDVAGLHVMPLTKKARSLTMPMLKSLGL